MSARDRIDPDARVPLDQLMEALPGGFNAIPDIVDRRAAVTALLAALEVPANPRVVKEDRTVPGPDGAPDVPVRIYRPLGAEGVLPGIFYIHGGGMVLGDIAGEDPTSEMICDEVGAVVVSVEYRLAPENPHPAPVEDCYAALVWMAKNADELGIDPSRLALVGGSAGGGLALGTALLARDRGGPPVKFMMPIYPMIDDRNTTPSSHEIADVGIWDREGNIEAWAWYLGDGKRRPVRRPGPGRRPDGPAAGVHRRRHRRPLPRRGHRVRAAADACGHPDGAARLRRRLPRGRAVRPRGGPLDAHLGRTARRAPARTGLKGAASAVSRAGQLVCLMFRKVSHQARSSACECSSRVGPGWSASS